MEAAGGRRHRPLVRRGRRGGAACALQAEPLPAPAWFQQQLQRLGYASPQTGTLDRATINVLAAFQMHYRPARYDGQPDAETAAIMMAMP